MITPQEARRLAQESRKPANSLLDEKSVGTLERDYASIFSLIDEEIITAAERGKKATIIPVGHLINAYAPNKDTKANYGYIYDSVVKVLRHRGWAVSSGYGVLQIEWSLQDGPSLSSRNTSRGSFDQF